MDISSYMPTRILCGAGVLKENAKLLAELGKRCLIVTGAHGAKKSGALDDLLDALQAFGIDRLIFDSITENPQTDDCFRAGESARGFGADFIVGVGGGSPLDAAKAVAIYASDPSIRAHDIYDRAQTARPLPVVLIGTTSGTGSEVTAVSVLTDSSTGRKRSVKGKNCCARVSFCDYRYTESMPRSVRVSTALDAFAHAYESYLSTTSNDLSRMYAKRAMEIVWPQLNAFFAGRDQDVDHESAYIASLYAGLAINITGTLAPHTLGYALTEEYHIPHGIACAVFAPSLLRHLTQNGNEKKVKELLTLLNTDMDSFEKVIGGTCGVDLRIERETIDRMKSRWTGRIASFSHVPGGFDAEDAVRVYRELFSDR